MEDNRCGYGTLSVKKKLDTKKPTTDPQEFIEQLKKSHQLKGQDTTILRKLYAGSWKDDNRHGLGTCYYENGDIYYGNWENDMKEGWGQMQYADGTTYEGEFHQEKRHGQGILLHSNIFYLLLSLGSLVRIDSL